MSLFSYTNFYEYTLTEKHIKSAVVVFSFALLVIGFLANKYVKEQKRLAWIISLVNSGVTTMIGIVYLSVKASEYKALFTFDSPQRELYHGIDNISALTCIWFAVANVFDLGFGLLFYRKYLGLITAYIHHTVFIWMMVAATTGNGGFLTVAPFAAAFTSMLIEELPTFLLALGSVFPSLRTDLGFGLTFFALRILLHVYYMVFGIYSRIDKPVICLYALTLVMHLNWFYAWATKYGSKLLQSADRAELKQKKTH